MYLKKNWNIKNIQHKNFTDLGKYIIELPDYDDPAIQKKGLALLKYRTDHGDISRLGCTCMMKRNQDGHVIAGRNMDVEISQYPAYVYRTTYGKYKNFCVTYLPNANKKYEDLIQDESISEDFKALLLYEATDCLNEKGLYIETNMRTSYAQFANYGLHSTHGETIREDGIPWKDLRVCTIAIAQLATQNCATVKEAVNYIKNSYDWYSIGLPFDPVHDGWNMCFMMADATGEYGLVEICQDEVHYIPYQFGQANYYITPKLAILDRCGSGQGRLDCVSRIIKHPDTLEEAMDDMKAVMWRNETLWIGESYRQDPSVSKNPYNQIVFKDDKDHQQLDWRSDYVVSWPVLDNGKMILEKDFYDNACKSSYDPKIKEYMDKGIASGKLIIDDGSITFLIDDKNCSLQELRKKYDLYLSLGLEPEKQLPFKPYYTVYNHLLRNQDACWVLNDKNFEALKAAAYYKLHVRLTEDGLLDLSGMSKYEKLLAYYGYNTEKNETYLRDDGEIWTTSLNIGVDCFKKEIKVRFWESDDTIVSYSFK